MANKYTLDEIERLGQEEGFNDGEIADVIGCSRATVNRNRNLYDIPKANLNNRLDKTFICLNCHKIITIRRKQVIQLYCNTCEKIVMDEIAASEAKQINEKILSNTIVE